MKIQDKQISSRQIEIEQEPDRMRPSDKPALVGDCSRLKDLGWKPLIPLEKTLADILEYWRARS